MKTLMEQFKDRINEANFSVSELRGFQANPKLAILAGMAIGYRMGIEKVELELSKLPRWKPQINSEIRQ